MQRRRDLLGGDPVVVSKPARASDPAARARDRPLGVQLQEDPPSAAERKDMGRVEVPAIIARQPAA